MNSFTLNGNFFEIPGWLRVALLPQNGEVPLVVIGPHNIPIIGVTAGNGQQFRLLVKLFVPDTRAVAVISFDGKDCHTKEACSLTNGGSIITNESRRFAWIDPIGGKITNLTFNPDPSGSPIVGVIGVAIYTEKPQKASVIEADAGGERGIGAGSSTLAKIRQIDFERKEPTEAPQTVFYALCGEITTISAYLEQITHSSALPKAFTDWHPDLFTR